MARPTGTGKDRDATGLGVQSVQDLLSLLFDQAPMGYMALSEDGRVLEINDAAVTLFGAPREQLLGQSLAEHVAPWHQERLHSYLRDVCAAAGDGEWLRHVLDLRPEGPDALPRRVRLYSRPYPSAAHGWCLTVLVDSSAEARAETARRESEFLQQAVLDALSAQIAVIDPDGRITAVNEAWRRFARENGGSAELEAGVGLNYLQVCRDALAEDVDQLADKAREGIRAVLAGERSEFVLEYPCHSALRQRWFLMTITPLGSGRAGAVVAHVDISERVRMEQEARVRREEVAHAARLSSVTVLAASLVHELSQPLAAVNLYGESVAALARSEPLDQERLLATADELREQVARAVGILDGLRRFMRRGELQTEPCALEERIRQAMGLVGPLARRKRVRMFLDHGDASIPVKVNPLQIEQVMVNLLCNGIEAIDRGDCRTRKIDIRAEILDGEARVTVADTGPGFSPEWLARVFDVFETEKETGMGMGLAVSRTIVEAHGGHLWAESGPDGGALLTFTLPVHMPEDER
ncbi:multi-sensor signal transduction histidine kinase [Thioalkalivibrio nitratireducens DSM 14787]|uniref:histidine kinase n=1 Tax=Thioalkalivibrio nitratireducens (strain DSM 14787 / UNIQEM 213 / ALEN2) TaxID=1255043 RepID=L0DVX2_THIND|nr:PAS domain-containing protein [Thioalkalivibrio nitratireducens]AGA33183.1 multi-sensor signal transduction histidine kinase [Thioalkalivibrio nitratireducens DSM 14787]